jgi:2-polyprenyl-6-methoxyphenol hydroxylase-like FAD-dependent oxidoreductase
MTHRGNKKEGLRAAVIGGSLGGLCAALALRGIDMEVEVFEKSRREMSDRGAGLVVQAEVLQLLEGLGITTRNDVSVPSLSRQYLNRDGSVAMADRSRQLMTSWDTIYRQLKDAFPKENYHHGSRLQSFEQKKSNVTARFEDGREITCDLLVGADGANSVVRRQLLPDVVPEYAGYVAWRGLVNEFEMEPAINEVFKNKFTFYQGANSHVLCYLIPGENGELSEGSRRLNWVWYWNVPEAELRAALTDKTGVFRDYSVPQGTVPVELIEKQSAIAEYFLPDVFRHLFNSTKEPFIQPIYDLSVPRMAFGRVCLIGDAAFVPRPHTAASTSKAANNAMTLAQAISHYQPDVLTALKQWEPSQMELGIYLRKLGTSLGTRSQFGSP